MSVETGARSRLVVIRNRVSVGTRHCRVPTRLRGKKPGFSQSMIASLLGNRNRVSLRDLLLCQG
ncbi:MAG: hypothetical protein ACRCT1_20355 [Microcoleaceae cyanobacterium]